MKATQQLTDEHAAIKRMLEILKTVCSKIEEGDAEAASSAESIVNFLKGFADKCHHGKEENILFRAMEKAGMATKGGPIEAMLKEHKTGRVFIKGMSKALADLRKNKINGIKKYVSNARSYIDLLSQHIENENTVLFPMADRLLDETVQNRLFDEFEDFEETKIGIGKHNEYHGLLEKLGKAYPGK
jgi:hemerythrin-like domain-containing protein